VGLDPLPASRCMMLLPWGGVAGCFRSGRANAGRRRVMATAKHCVAALHCCWLPVCRPPRHLITAVIRVQLMACCRYLQ
jgi:hypothetical protein